jgi:hypothetical protein
MSEMQNIKDRTDIFQYRKLSAEYQQLVMGNMQG